VHGLASRHAWKSARGAGRALPALCAALLAAMLGACETATHEQLPIGGTHTVVRAGPTHAWSIELDGEEFGRVVRYEVPGWPQETRFVVQNPFGQDLGMIDALGRFYRYRPFEEPVWLGTGTVAEGAAAVLGLSGAPRLEEVALREDASAPAEAGAPQDE